MLYAVMFALLALYGCSLYLHDRERQVWAEERRNLLNRIQAPLAAQASASEELSGPAREQLSDAERIRRKAEEMGLSVNDLRMPESWAGMG